MNSSQFFLIFLFFLCSVLIIITKNIDPSISKRRSMWIIVFVFILVVTRPDTMADYKSYIEDFKYSQYSLNSEPAFNGIKFLVQSVGSFYIGFVSYAFISLGIRFKYIKRYPELSLFCLLVFISNFLVLQDMIAIRSAVASALLLFLVDAKNDKRYIKCLLIILVAICFHYSAFLFFIIFFLNSHKPHRFLFLCLIPISYIITLAGFTFGASLGIIFDLNILPFALHSYSDQELNIFNLIQVAHIIICLYAWWKINIISHKYPNVLLFLKLYTIAICLLPLFSDFISVGIRISELLLSVEIILIPMIISGTIKNRNLQIISVILYSSVIFYFTINNLQYWNAERYSFPLIR